MKYLLPFIILIYSCNPLPGKTSSPEEKYDTTLTKEKAAQELGQLRSAVTDPGFAAMLDASLQIQQVEFVLQKADSSRIKEGFADSLVIKTPDGQLLFTYMHNLYRLALEHSRKTSDINYYKTQLLIGTEDWLMSKFHSKKTYEALISIFLIQKDVALISMIVNNADTEENRKRVETQYSSIIKNMEKSYGSWQ